MSTLSDHRTIIASLFLPTSTAAAFHLDPPTQATKKDDTSALLSVDATPNESQENLAVPPPQKSPTTAKFPRQRPGISRHSTALSLSGAMPSASIIEDLLASQSNRTATGTPITTPNRESTNPFATFAASAKRLLGLGERSEPSTPATPPISNDEDAVRGRGLDIRVVDDEDDKPLAAGSAPMYRRLSRKQSKGAVTAAFTREVSVGPWEVETNPMANGGLHNAVQSIEGDLKSGKVWIGVLGPETDDVSPEMRKDIEERMLTRDSVPVWVKDSDFSGCYDDFCHQVLWPSLHYIIPDAPRTKAMYESNSFVQYKAVNEAFAEKIASIWKEGDVIWVNDYHLLLLPQLLRARLPRAAIGFFLHVAFPSSEIFRCLAARESLLRGMLGADLLGFQTHSYARHFRQTVSRILSVEATPKGIQLPTSGLNLLENSPFSPVEEDRAASQRAWLHGHPLTALEKAEAEVDQTVASTASEHNFVDVAVFPMGIDVQSLAKKRREKEVGEWVKSLRERYKGMKMIVARDKLDEVQGVRQKFMAFERFLEQNKEFHGKVMLIQVALTTSVANELQGSVTDVISRINMKFSTLTYQPIIFFHTHDVTFSQYLALLTVADCFIVTSMREGMALRAHEFVECQEERKRPLILSEFTGSYSFSGFRTCLPINPWDIQETANAILTSLTMNDEEAASRWADLHSHVNTQTAQQFATTFLNRTIRVNYKHHIKDSLNIASLDISAVRSRYHALSGPESRRLILVDLERTLWPFDASPPPQSNEVPEEAIKILEKLVGDERNEVWALSGLPVKGKLETVADRLPSLGICAEHGAFMKPRGSSEWINMIRDSKMGWMAPCMEILQYFTERTPNSFIDKREGTIVWRYLSSENDEGDRSWARRQAAEAQNHIYDSLGERYRLRIIPALSSFIILPKILGRTTAVAAILHPVGLTECNINSIGNVTAPWPTQDMGEVNRFEYILAIGSDESLMNRLKRVQNAETVYTGLRKSGGSNWRCDPDEIYRDLEAIIKE